MFISGCTDPKAMTILLRGGTINVVDEAERTMHDALCVVGIMIDKKNFVAGGGAIEMEISARLLDFAIQAGGKEQLAVGNFLEPVDQLLAFLLRY